MTATHPTLPTAGGYVQLDEGDVVGRMLADDKDITVLADALRRAHLLDASGPLLSAFTRLDGLMEAAAIEIRLIHNYLGGKYGTVTYPADSTVEVVEPADDPSRDLVGAVRRSPGGRVAHKIDTDEQPWAEYITGFTSYVWRGDADVAGWAPIGAVPGTPAAANDPVAFLREVTKAARHVGETDADYQDRMMGEPRVFRSDGPEPPADVKVLEWLDIDDASQFRFVRRVSNGWLWSQWPDRQTPKFREVLS